MLNTIRYENRARWIQHGSFQTILCGETEEETDHFWSCPAMQKEREYADTMIADIPHRWFPIAVRHGIAPAMGADPKFAVLGKRDVGVLIVDFDVWRCDLYDPNNTPKAA